MNKKTILKFLNEKKLLVGLGDYGVFLVEPVNDGDAECTVVTDHLNKTLKITPSKDLYSKATNEKIQSVLMHELIHGRLNIYEKQKSELCDALEEELSNDLERGFMSLQKVDTQKEAVIYNAGNMERKQKDITNV